MIIRHYYKTGKVTNLLKKTTQKPLERLEQFAKTNIVVLIFTRRNIILYSVSGLEKRKPQI